MMADGSSGARHIDQHHPFTDANQEAIQAVAKSHSNMARESRTPLGLFLSCAMIYRPKQILCMDRILQEMKLIGAQACGWMEMSSINGFG